MNGGALTAVDARQVGNGSSRELTETGHGSTREPGFMAVLERELEAFQSQFRVSEPEAPV